MNEVEERPTEETHAPATEQDDSASDQQQHADPDPGAAQEAEADRHQLDPGGDRFKQVWARAKKAEEEREALKDRLHQEQLERAKLEGERKAEVEARQQQKQAEREMSWDELETGIEQQRWTRAQANAYKEQMQKKRLDAMQQEFDTKLAQLTVKEKVSVINADLDRYKKAMPAMLQDGTPERTKLVGEYTYLVQSLGYPDNLATQLAAARAAFGPPDALERQATTKAATTQQRTAFMDTATTSTKPANKTKDPIQGLTPMQKEHYSKLIKNGRYGSFRAHEGITDEHWDEVRKELTWTRGKKK